MLIPQWAARAILPWGTTTVCTDPHEIANVAGRQGVAFMLDNARRAGLRQYILAPSCVPAVPGLESAGASFSAQDVAELLDMPGVIGIAEMMDYIGLAHGAERMRDIAAEGLRRGAYLQGHAPGASGSVLAAYTGENRESDHALVPGALLEALDQRQESGMLTLTDRCVRAASNRSATWR